jgi:hypothetical protein
VKRLYAIILSILIASVLTVVTAPSATAADPGPQVTIDRGLHMLKGTLSDTSSTPRAPVFVKWHQYDPNGIASEHGSVQHYVSGSGYVTDVSFSTVRTTANFNAEVGEYYRVTIVATNNKGVTSTTTEYIYGFALAQESAATYSAGWSTGTCACWSDGSALKSSKAGQTATFRFQGNQVALITDRAAGRGTADLFLDGAKVGTFNGKASATTNLLIVPTKYKVISGQHTLQVKVTSGRIDVDGFLYSG